MSDAAEDHQSGPVPRPRAMGGWIYLGVLSVVAVAMGVAAFAFDGDGGRSRGLPGVVEPVELVLRVDGPRVLLEGRVPEADVRDGLVSLAGARYGAPNVGDGLLLDDRTTLDGGAVAIIGSTGDDDPDPLRLQADIAAAYLLRAGPVQLRTVPGSDEGGPSVAMVPTAED